MTLISSIVALIAFLPTLLLAKSALVKEPARRYLIATVVCLMTAGVFPLLMFFPAMAWLAFTLYLFGIQPGFEATLFRSFLRLEGRIGRLQFAGLFFPSLALIAMSGAGFGIGDKGISLSKCVCSLAVVGGVWLSVALIAKRLHDTNRSAWLAIIFPVNLAMLVVSQHYSLGLLMIVFIIVLFQRGTAGTNRFGKDTLANEPPIETHAA